MTTTYELYTNENGTPKAVEGKAPAIIERVEALEETLDNGVVTSVNGNTGDITPEQTGCLPLSGGTMTGAITLPTSVDTLGKGISAKSALHIKGGTSLTDGATLALYGSETTLHKGGFLIQTDASQGANKVLIGLPDGSLKWNNKDVITSAGGVLYGSLGKSTTGEEFAMFGGTNYGDGACIVLYGGDCTSGYGHGQFLIRSSTSSGEIVDLVGNPNNGTLTWGGVRVACVSSWSNGQSWYRKWSDGWIEQGGYVEFPSKPSSGSVTFPTAFTMYPTIVSTAIFSAIAEYGISGISTTQFTWVSNTGGKVGGVEYYACGY